VSLTWVLVVDVAAWTVVGLAAGYGMTKVPSRRLAEDGWLTRVRSVERGGRLYEHLGIRRWKDRLPDAGGWFRGGVAKRTTGGPSSYERFVIETRRGEITHWLVLAAAPFFALWNPPGLLVAMVVYAVVANLPCILVQRYNRARLERITTAWSARRPRQR
jgi:glycosyl-4,4'-diaponeurosporenoate acyltransferase